MLYFRFFDFSVREMATPPPGPMFTPQQRCEKMWDSSEHVPVCVIGHHVDPARTQPCKHSTMEARGSGRGCVINGRPRDEVRTQRCCRDLPRWPGKMAKNRLCICILNESTGLLTTNATDIIKSRIRSSRRRCI